MSRLKNYGFWASTLAFIPMVMKSLGVDVVPDQYNELINAILTILVFLGIISNPTTQNKGYMDDKKA